MPQRVQRKRTKGWKMPPNTVYVGRSTMWGNYAAHVCCITDHAAAKEAFRCWVEEVASPAWKGRAAIDLKGKDLACWCPLDQPCHADVLLDLANCDPGQGGKVP
jgi:hypothetical protein